LDGSLSRVVAADDDAIQWLETSEGESADKTRRTNQPISHNKSNITEQIILNSLLMLSSAGTAIFGNFSEYCEVDRVFSSCRHCRLLGDSKENTSRYNTECGINTFHTISD